MERLCTRQWLRGRKAPVLRESKNTAEKHYGPEIFNEKTEKKQFSFLFVFFFRGVQEPKRFFAIRERKSLNGRKKERKRENGTASTCPRGDGRGSQEEELERGEKERRGEREQIFASRVRFFFFRGTFFALFSDVAYPPHSPKAPRS